MLDAGCWMLDAGSRVWQSSVVSRIESRASSHVDHGRVRQNNKTMSNAAEPADPTDWRSLYPFESHWFEPGSGFGRMHFIDESPNLPLDGTLLFVHGNPTWSFHWRRFILALRGHYRCVAPDHIGCGLSDKPSRRLRLWNHIHHLSTLVSTLDLRRVTLVAQDWGGAIGLATVLAMPTRFERIILFNTGAFPPPYIPWRIRACRIPVLGRLAVQGANLFSRAALRLTLARRHSLEFNVAAGYLAPYNSWANRRGVYGFVRDIPAPPGRVSPIEDTPCRKLAFESQRDSATNPSETGSNLDERRHMPRRSTFDTLNLLAMIERQLPSLADRRVLLVWGMRDWCFRPDCLQRFIEAWPNAEVHRLADVGHWVVEDAPEESLAIVKQFLETSK
jgi:haloalkane dehalogenase